MEKPQFIRKNGKVIPIGGKKKKGSSKYANDPAMKRHKKDVKKGKNLKGKLTKIDKKSTKNRKNLLNTDRKLQGRNTRNFSEGAGIGAFFGATRNGFAKKALKFDKKTAAFAVFGGAASALLGDKKSRSLKKKRSKLRLNKKKLGRQEGRVLDKVFKSNETVQDAVFDF